MGNKAVFFDRDGTINEDMAYLYKKEDFKWIAGAKEAIKYAKSKGYLVIVVTNQSGVARGYFTEDDVKALHNFIDDELAEEALLRQLLKFQLPSPYHTEVADRTGLFFVKPYLEIFRLIYTLGTVTFDEIMIFGMQLTNYKKFDKVEPKVAVFA